MLPHKHFLISCAAIAPFSLKTPQWILISGLTSALIDTDVVVLVWLNSKREESLKQFRNPGAIFKRYDIFMETIAETGVLNTALKTHFIFSALILLAAGLFFRPYFTPVAVGVATHILSDLPLLKKHLFGPGRLKSPQE